MSTQGKAQPYDKTVVAELKIQLADLMTRTVALKSSVAAPIPRSDPYNSGDIVLTMTNLLRIPQVNSCIILSSFQNFDVLLMGVDTNETIVLECKGLFVHYGSMSNIIVRPSIQTQVETRLQYIWS